ncbi:hypothetical protein EUTSA_v10017174mg [Eutrema salsugineum]|uniref:Uncharacterized protein n=1 Tax=Eutrema salsugineum TaxID=72664 RepID=V4P154_EUTSA|nr:uncharacterized protein LOC18026508 [Eutrema salsugineum]ESQ53011.1 hypothetical protein EUTSA_v10017174mg [Eutrema salsugineum]
MEKEGEDEENTIEEASNSAEDVRSEEEDEKIRGTVAELVDPVDSTEEGSTDPSNSYTFGFQDHDVNESDMEEEEKVLEFFRRNSGLIPYIDERNNFPYLNKSQGMVLEFQEDTPAETEQANANIVFHSFNDSNEFADQSTVNLNSPEVPEEIKSSSASDKDTDDSSSDSDHDSSLSRYYFDGSLPVSAHVEELETHQDESSSVRKDENQMPLLCPKQPVLQPTSWRNCCGLLELLRAADL